jgi:peptidoglycan/xylan/chitin deacetylase (PgdA/CDA1 family)
MRNIRTLALVVAALFLSPFVGVSRGGAGMVSLVFDDGLSSVYQYAYPVLAKYGLPATVGIIANRVESGDPDFMTEAQIRVLAKAGWEVASHSLTHKRPVDIPKFYAEEKCLNLRPVSGQRTVFEGRYRYEELAGLVENGRLLRERSNGRLVRQERGSYYFDELIGELIVHPYEPDSVEKQQIRAISYERELDESKKILEGMGFHVSTYITPHNYWTPEMSALSRRFYDQVADGGDDCNRKGQTDRFWLKRFVVHTNDPAEAIIGLVNLHAILENSWVIFCLHGVGAELGWEPWSVERLAKLCAYLKRKAIPVVTIDKGVRIWVEGKGKPGI